MQSSPLHAVEMAVPARQSAVSTTQEVIAPTMHSRSDNDSEGEM